MKKAVEHLRASDPAMKRVVEAVGPCRMTYLEPEMSTLVRSIVHQQLSGKAARTILGRLHEAVGDEGYTPARIAKLRMPKLRSLGLSAQKASYLKDLASRTGRGDLDFNALPALPDEAVIEKLTEVKGVGVWTAQMFLMFALRRMDVMPTGDLGIRNAIQKVYAMEAPPKPVEMEAISQPWRPYRTVACWYLWRSLDGPAGL